MENITGFQRDLLYVVLNKEDPSGQSIKKEIESYYDGNINHGRLYPNLDELVDKELVIKGKQDERTNYYSITPEGIRAIQDYHNWVSDMVSSTDGVPQITA